MMLARQIAPATKLCLVASRAMFSHPLEIQRRPNWLQIHTSVVPCHSGPELTPVRYKVERGNFSKVSDDDVNFFLKLLGPHRIILDESELESYNTDWFKRVRGSSSILLKPKTTEEVSEIMKYCSERVLAVCPQGGNTSVCGGSVPVFDEIIISTALMNEIESVDPLSGVVVCQPGCVLETLDQHVDEYNLMIPLDLAAKGSCQIGGNISTNAGGLRLLRYGSLHGSILGIEAVLASGEIIDCLSSMKKDNTGYDLKHLFIGSEGTLGIVTKIAISCPPRPRAINVAFLGLNSFKDVVDTYVEAKSKLGEILSSCEFMDHAILELVEVTMKQKSPIEKYPFYMLIETSGSNQAHDEEKLNKFLEESLESGRITDGTVATEPSRIRSIWSVRESVAGALNSSKGYFYTYDLSVPHKYFYKMVEDTREHIGDPDTHCSACGHLGDGNVHLQIIPGEYSQEMMNSLETWVYEKTAEVKGSVSAEHGLGFLKKNYMHYSKSENAIHLMKELKKLMDPKGILNPYKFLPEDS